MLDTASLKGGTKQINKLMWNNCPTASPVIETTSSNLVLSNKEVSDKTCIN